MNNDWNRIKEIFGAALELPEAERRDYVLAQSGGDPEISRTVLQLLQNHFPTPSIAKTKPAYRGRMLKDGELVYGRFRVVRFIAAGGMGEVYEVFDETVRARLALKTLRPELLSEPDAFERSRGELLAAHEVAHENLCRVYDLVMHSPQNHPGVVVPCITMQFLDGESLAEYLSRNRPVDPASALPWLRQIAGALDALHRADLVHRDLKPSNIMLVRGKTGETVAIVTDFGLTRAIENDSSVFESGREQNAGAPYFMAPESLRHGRSSRESDIYAFGLVADEMVTRTRAFPTRSLPELIYAKVWGAAIAPKDRAENLPARWNQAIQRAIHKEPAKRFQTALEFVGALADRVEHPDEPPNWTRRLAIAAALSGGGYFIYRGLPSLESSVEVFDFENQSADAGQDYFCRGTGLELMRRLMHVDGLRVVPRHATRVKSAAPSKTRFSLDGALQAHEGRIRLSVFLTDNQNGQLVWSQAFDRRQITNPLSLQLDLANGAADALEKHLTSDDDKDVLAAIIRGSRRWLGIRFQSRLASAPTADGVAFDLYMRGSKLLEEFSPSSIAAAIDHFQKAVERDPNFALAWAASADAHLNQGIYASGMGTDPFLEARLRAETAVRVQPALAEAHLSLAAVRQAEWRWAEADSEYGQVLRQRPNMARANRWYGGFIIQFGRFDEALQYGRRAMELDPYDRGAPVTYSLCLIIAGRYREAIDLLSDPALQYSAAANSNLAQAHALLAKSLSGPESAAHFDSALKSAQRASELDRTPEESRVAGDQIFGIVHALMGNVTELDERIARLERMYRQGRMPGNWLAHAYALSGRKNDALDVIEAMLRRRDSGLKYIKVIPFLASLRGEPRFQAVIRDMKL